MVIAASTVTLFPLLSFNVKVIASLTKPSLVLDDKIIEVIWFSSLSLSLSLGLHDMIKLVIMNTDNANFIKILFFFIFCYFLLFFVIFEKI